MGKLKRITQIIWGNEEEVQQVSLSGDWWKNGEVENPGGELPEQLRGEIAVQEEPKPVKVLLGADVWGSVKKPRGPVNLLKLVVTLFMLVDVAAALMLVSSSTIITAAALAVFLPNAVFLFILRGKL